MRLVPLCAALLCAAACLGGCGGGSEGGAAVPPHPSEPHDLIDLAS